MILRSWRFTPGQDLTGFIRPGTSINATLPFYDPVVDGLRFTVPSISGTNSAGAFLMNFTPGSLNQIHTGGDADKGPDYYWARIGDVADPDPHGLGRDIYVSWRQRFSPAFLANAALWKADGTAGWKQLIIGDGDRYKFLASSCTDLEVVTVNGNFLGFPQHYHSCGAKEGSKYEGLYEALTSGGYRLQNAVDRCLYNADQSGCLRYVADEWMTFQQHIRVGTWYRNDKVYHRDSWFRAWMGRAGSPLALYHDIRDYDLVNTMPGVQKYGKAWWLPYMTGKQGGIAAPEAYTWIQDLVIATEPLLDPVTGALPPQSSTFGDQRWNQNVYVSNPPPPPPPPPPPVDEVPPPGDGIVNPEIDALADNTWKKLTIGPSTRYLTSVWETIPTISTRNTPQRRTQSGVYYGLLNGRPTLMYIGTGHTSHQGNDIEFFDIISGVWTQATYPECSRIWEGTVVSATLTTTTLSPTDRVTGVATSTGFRMPNVVGTVAAGSNSASRGITGAAVDANGQVTITHAAWASVPPAGTIIAIWYADGARRVESGFNPTILAPSGHPYVEHYQDFAKWSPSHNGYLVSAFQGTGLVAANGEWTWLAGSMVPGNTVSPKSSISFRALMEYDADLAALGNSGLQLLQTELGSADLGKWLLGSDNRWTRRNGSLPKGLPSLSGSAAPFVAYAKSLKRHIVRFFISSPTPTYLWYLYDAVADVWTPLQGMPANLAYPFTFDDGNGVLLCIDQSSATVFRLWAIDVTTSPVGVTLLPNLGPVPLTDGLFPSTLVSGNFRYDPRHGAALYVCQAGGADTIQTWAYRYKKGVQTVNLNVTTHIGQVSGQTVRVRTIIEDASGAPLAENVSSFVAVPADPSPTPVVDPPQVSVSA